MPSFSSSSSSMSLGSIWIDNARVVPTQFESGATVYARYDYQGYQPESGSLIRWYKEDRYQRGYDDRAEIGVVGDAGDTWFFTVTPSDGWQYGTTVRSVSGVVIELDATAGIVVEIVPHNPQVTDNLYLAVGGRIQRSGATRYTVRWFRNDIELVGYRNKYSVPYTEISEGDVFSVEVGIFSSSSFSSGSQSTSSFSSVSTSFSSSSFSSSSSSFSSGSSSFSFSSSSSVSSQSSASSSSSQSSFSFSSSVSSSSSISSSSSVSSPSFSSSSSISSSSSVSSPSFSSSYSVSSSSSVSSPSSYSSSSISLP